MALYRNIAGFERLGLFIEAETNGGSGDGLAIQPAPSDDTFIQVDPGIYQQAADKFSSSGTLTIDPLTLRPVLADSVQPATTVPVLSPVPAQVQEIDYWPLITLAGLYITMIKGEVIFRDTRKLAFVGGLGALYYLFYKKSSPVTPGA